MPNGVVQYDWMTSNKLTEGRKGTSTRRHSATAGSKSTNASNAQMHQVQQRIK